MSAATGATTSADFFEAKYRADGDPWKFAESEYELWRYECIVKALDAKRYARAFEPGCSVGVLTAKLAEICDAVEAVDFSSTAVSEARARCAAMGNVSVECMSLVERMPVRGFDLIVLSEIGYYFAPAQWREIARELVEEMEPGTTMLAAHWLGVSKDHLMGGDDVHQILREDERLELKYEERHEGFRLDRWTKR